MKGRGLFGISGFALPLLSASLFGCSSCRPPSAEPEASTGSEARPDAALSRGLDAGSEASTADAHAEAAAPKRALCKVVLPPFVIDKGVRADSGVSVTSWVRTEAKPAGSGDAAPDGSLGEAGPRVVLGYAKAHGTPYVAEIDERGRVFRPKVPSKLEVLERKPDPDVKRVVSRVVPRMPHGDDARASVDYAETWPDKTRHVHCGAAEAGPYVSFDGPAITLGSEAESETLECRSVLGKAKTEHVALESQVSFDGRRVEATLRFAGKPVSSRTTSLKSGEKPSDRFGFTQLGLGTTGEVYVVTARIDGSVALVLGRSSAGDHRDETFSLGSPPNAPTALALGAGYTLFGSLPGKPTVYGLRLPFDEKAGRFDKLDKPWTWPTSGDDPEERSFVSAVTTGASTWLLVGERAGTRKTAKLYAVDGPHVRGTFSPLEDEANVIDAKLEPTAKNEVFVAYVTLDEARTATLKATVLACE
jgi:hypothetical protein